VSTVAVERPTTVGRIWSTALAAWGSVVGLLPHVLLTWACSRVPRSSPERPGALCSAAIGFVAAISSLRRLHRRFGTWRAPVIALALFAAMFSLSSFVIGPAISGDDAPARPGIEQDGHEQHH